MNVDEIIERAGRLPASLIAERLNRELARSGTVVVTAPPGAGKSTLLPLTIMAGFGGGKILMLEPRRLAARQIAERMAHTLGEAVGHTVGYRVRFESKVSAATRVEVLTEGILTRMLIDDATLDGVDTVIFDEFHERSINSDLALALTRLVQQTIRPELRLVVMSATIDASAICTALGAPLVESEGRMHAVRLTHSADDCPVRDCARTVASAVCKVHREYDGDILAFLPGQGEIAQCVELLGDSLAPTRVCPLYGNLPPEQQRRAIAPSAPGERKVVLATPIAETSVTIEGVRAVVDSGLCRKLVFDPRTGLSHLETVRISLDMATQRTGRAGRVAQGVCHRLWTLATEHHMEQQRKPEIVEADLAPMVLGVAAFGEADVMSLPWLTPPPAGSVAGACRLLGGLGAIDHGGNITATGRRMAALPCHPRIARMILGASSQSLKSLACDIAALLEEKDPMADSGDANLLLRVAALRAARMRKDPGRWGRIAKIAAEYRRMVHAGEDNGGVAATDAGRLVAYAYPERVAVAADGVGRYRLAGGGVVAVDQADTIAAHEWIAIASMHAPAGGAGRVFLAAPLNPGELDGGMLSERDHVAWDGKQGCVVARHECRIGSLVISSKPLHNVDQSLLTATICQAVHKEGLSMLDWNDDVQRLQRRVAQVAAWHPEMCIPDLSTPHLLATAEQWLPLYLNQGGRIPASVAELKRVDLCSAVWAIVPYELQSEIDRLAPSHVQVPTGSRIRVDYRQGAEAPVLSVRLQECFGMASTPCVDGGRQPLLMELLSPGFKPVQLTQDLQSFWQNTYFEVRKEMRRRYPKHYWPDNPLEAPAVRGVKRNNGHR